MREFNYMKQNKTTFLIIFLSVIVTAVLAAVHLISRPDVPENSLLVLWQGKEHIVDFDSLGRQKVQGILVNGKGQEKEINTEAAALADVLKAAGIDVRSISAAVITASDEYSAEYSASEVNAVFLMQDEENKITAFIFGDQNAKRRVHDVTRIEAE